MKLLTVNFLTCAVKSCKASLSTTNITTNPPDAPQPASASTSSFPLHFRDALLERTEIPYNRLFIQNILPRVHWEALTTTATELGLRNLLPPTNPADDDSFLTSGIPDSKADGDASPHHGEEVETEMRMEVETGEAQSPRQHDSSEAIDRTLRQLHTLLLETAVTEGKLVCGKCGFEYPIKEGVGNFLLPGHLGEWFCLGLPFLSLLRHVFLLLAPSQNLLSWKCLV